MELISRKAAKLTGLNTYYTGKLCANNHLSYRYVTSGSCAECVNGRRDGITPNVGESRSAALRRKADEIESKEIAKNVILENARKERENILQLAIAKTAERETEAQAKRNERELTLAVAMERNKTLKSFNEIKCPVRPEYIERVKALLFAYAIMRCAHITEDDLWPGGTPKHGVLYRMNCHPLDADAIRAQINEWYSIDSNINQIRESIVNERIKQFADEVESAAKKENAHILKY